jgi:5-methylcytosine-specific restriction endonuclease McrA
MLKIYSSRTILQSVQQTARLCEDGYNCVFLFEYLGYHFYLVFHHVCKLSEYKAEQQKP